MFLTLRVTVPLTGPVYTQRHTLESLFNIRLRLCPETHRLSGAESAEVLRSIKSQVKLSLPWMTRKIRVQDFLEVPLLPLVFSYPSFFQASFLTSSGGRTIEERKTAMMVWYA